MLWQEEGAAFKGRKGGPTLPKAPETLAPILNIKVLSSIINTLNSLK